MITLIALWRNHQNGVSWNGGVQRERPNPTFIEESSLLQMTYHFNTRHVIAILMHRYRLDAIGDTDPAGDSNASPRSEERRVGKEC